MLVAAQLGLAGAAAAQDKRVRIGAIGDSYGSGEGAPDAFLPAGSGLGTAAQRDALWRASPAGSTEARTDASCHRSARAWPRKAADRFSREHGQPIDFSSFACSGAEIPHLMGKTVQFGSDLCAGGPTVDGPSVFKGVGSGCPPELGGQLCEIERRFAGQMVDALLVSIGGNDAGFGPTVMHCAVTPPIEACQNMPIIDTPLTQGASTDVEQGRCKLRALYRALAQQIELVNQRGHSYIANVFFAEYPSPLTAANGNLCNPSPLFPAPVLGMPSTRVTGDGLDTIDGREARWAADTIIPALNAMVRECATMIGDAGGNPYGFYVPGVADRFLRHGYCAGDGRWLNLLGDSLRAQGTPQGAVHPNYDGHDAYRDAVVAQLGRLVPPSEQAFKLRADVARGESGIAATPGGLRLVWSGAVGRVAGYQIAARSAHRNGALVPLEGPAPKWPASFGAPPRHLGTDDQDWSFVSATAGSPGDTFISRSPQQAVVSMPPGTLARDFAVRACTDAMCAPWSAPIRVEMVDSFARRPPITGLRAEKVGRREIKVTWPPQPPRANTFDEIALSRNGTDWQGRELPAGAGEVSIGSLSLAGYLVTIRECTWNVVSPTDRQAAQCSPFSDPVAVDLAPLRRGNRPPFERNDGVTPTRPRVPPVDYHVRLDRRSPSGVTPLRREPRYSAPVAPRPVPARPPR